MKPTQKEIEAALKSARTSVRDREGLQALDVLEAAIPKNGECCVLAPAPPNPRFEALIEAVGAALLAIESQHIASPQHVLDTRIMEALTAAQAHMKRVRE